jgi:hypothetical protein
LGLVLLLLTLGACQSTVATPSSSGAVGSWASGPIFSDISAAAGLDFTHRNGMTGERYFVEAVGAGGAMLDYDNDGDLDLYLVQGSPLTPGPASAGAPTPTAPGADDLTWRGRLFRNDLAAGADGTLTPRFTDVTQASGITASGYGMGVATGDYDNDGDLDLYLTNWGANQLWQNNGDGTFTDRTAAAAADDPRWSTSASFVDYDRDGWLDLYITNYTVYSYANEHPCYSVTGAVDYCGPHAYPPERDKLLRNKGDGSFEDVTDRVGMTKNAGPGLGVVATDLNGDGWQDIYVANDESENFLWLNDQGQRFENTAPMSGTAVNRDGKATSSMGLNAADFDNDGDDDLFVTNLNGETNTFFVNDGQATFSDATNSAQDLGPASLPFTGFGTVNMDLDSDGWLDLVVANGEVKIVPEQAAAGDPYPLKQTNLLFRNLGGGRFADETAHAGPSFAEPAVGRGIAAGDIDNDGDPDLLITNNNGPARLLRNDFSPRGRWLGLRLVGSDGQRDMLGARVRLIGGSSSMGSPVRRAHTDGSYVSASDPRLLIGLGEQGSVDGVEVTWPSGETERWMGLTLGKYHTLVQGEGSD